jgi:hypothetical protein
VEQLGGTRRSQGIEPFTELPLDVLQVHEGERCSREPLEVPRLTEIDRCRRIQERAIRSGCWFASSPRKPMIQP